MNLHTAPSRAKNALIEHVRSDIVDLPFKRLQRFARHEARVQSALLIRIRSSDGLEGVGEAVVPCGPWWSGDSVETMKIMLDRYLAPQLTGRPAHDVGPVLAELDRHVRNNSFVKAGIEMALLDLVGKLHDLPIWALLGGRFRDRCPVAWPVASGDMQQDLAEMDEMLDGELVSAFKVKMGSESLHNDVRRVAKLSAALDGRARVRVDPNEAWSELDALHAMPRLAEAGIELVEQPVRRDHLDAMARIARCSQIAVMIDEGAQSASDVVDVIGRQAAHIISLKLMKAGGLQASRRMADIAEAGGLSVYMGTFLETSIGTAAGLHLGASLPRLPLGGELVGPLLLAEDLVTTPIRYRQGAAFLPDGPGLGVVLDEDKVARFTRRE